MGALQQLQQPKKRVADILTWICCFTLYIAVMAAKRHDLVGPMISHIHTVMWLQDGISLDLCSLSYISIDDISRVIASLGRGDTACQDRCKECIQDRASPST